MLKIEYRKLSEIVPYENNPRMNEKAVEEVAKSIKEFGFNVPIIIDENGIIIAGHTRYKAANRLNLEEAPTIIVQDLTPEQVKAFRIMDNKASEYAEWDYEKLLIELEELKVSDYNIENSGFDEDEYLNMINNLSSDDEPIMKEDFDIEKELEKAQDSDVKPGQIHRLGRHYLMCGDSTSEDDVKKLMSASGQMVKANMVWTDPPYNVDYEDSKGRSIINDNMSDSQFKKFLVNIFRNYFNFTEDSCPFYVCYASKEHINFEAAMRENNIDIRSQIIWVKNQANLSFANYKWKHEPILYGFKKNNSLNFYGDRKQTTVWENLQESKILEIEEAEGKKVIKVKGEGCSYYITVDNIGDIEIDSDDNTTVWQVGKETDYIHPNQKPIKLIRKAVRNSSKPGDVLLELFGGSGSTLMTAEQTDRVCYCMELDPVYAKLIINRFEKATGIQSLLINE